ncbi:MAG: hypothetical protein HOP10_02065 [Chitinophagaceae bacterium]|nr:hypothetical protein [Chitinophagaceae bacterium]
MASNVPLTIQTGVTQNYGSYIVIGSNALALNYQLQNIYWAVVVDRSNLNVVQNFTFTDNQNVPSQLTPYIGNPQYILILTTQNLSSTNLPAGNFYQLLVKEGAGVQLQRLEQIYEALSCGTWGWMGYTLVAVLDNSTSYESAEFYDNAFVTTLQLIPVQVGSGVLYTPATL